MSSPEKKNLTSVFAGIKAKNSTKKETKKKTSVKKKKIVKKKVIRKPEVIKKQKEESKVEESEEEELEDDEEIDEDEEEEVEEKPKKKIIKRKKKKKLEKKKLLICGDCQSSSEEEPSIKLRKFKYADGSSAEDNLCDKCFGNLEQETQEEVKPVKKKIKFPRKKKKKSKEEVAIEPEDEEESEEEEEEEEEESEEKEEEKKPKKKRKMKLKKKKVSKRVSEASKKVTKSKDSTIPMIKGLITSEEELRKVLGKDVIHFDDGEEIEDLEGVVICIMGLKGDGKTSLALSVERGMFDPELARDPSKCEHEDDVECEHCRETIIFAISMDGQTNRIAKQYRKHGKRIHVYNGLKYYSERSDEVRLMTSTLSCHFIEDVLTRQIPEKCKALYGVDRPDFIMIDDMEELAKMAEGKMRDQKSFGLYDRFDWVHWTHRNQTVDEIHRRASEMAKEAVVYTTYMKWDIVKEDDKEEKQKIPKWVASVKKKTNIVIESRAVTVEGVRTFQAQVLNAKDIGWNYNRKQCHTDFKGLGGLYNLREPVDEEKFFEPIRE